MATRSTATRTWRWCRVHPKTSGLGVAVLVALYVVGSSGHEPGHDAAPARSSPPVRVTAAPVDRTQRSDLLAATVLAGLAIKGRAPRTGYDRAEFGAAWTDDNSNALGHNGCDTRNDILRRDLSEAVTKAGTSGCLVLDGVLHDPYTARSITFHRGPDSGAVQIDHVVALSDAWQTGAGRFDTQTRTDFANDPLNLLAVDGSTNEPKGDGDAATWLPPNKAYRCAYVARQVAVKARYRLWITAAEHDATQRILGGCAGQRAPGESKPVRIALNRPSTTPPDRQSSAKEAPALPVPVRPSQTQRAGCTTTSSGACIRGGQLCPQDSYSQSGADAAGRSYVCTGDSEHPHWELP